MRQSKTGVLLTEKAQSSRRQTLQAFNQEPAPQYTWGVNGFGVKVATLSGSAIGLACPVGVGIHELIDIIYQQHLSDATVIDKGSKNSNL